MSRLYEITKEEMAKAEPGPWGENDARIKAYQRYITEIDSKKPFSFVDFVKRKMEHSYKTWPEQSVLGVLDHARKECNEIETNPTDSMEWVDLILLGIDGACRSGLAPEQLSEMLEKKLAVNLERDWTKPNSPDQAVEHDRSQTSILRKEIEEVLQRSLDDDQSFMIGCFNGLWKLGIRTHDLAETNYSSCLRITEAEAKALVRLGKASDTFGLFRDKNV